MKKRLLFPLLALLFAMTLSFLPAFAAGIDATANVSSATAYRGETVTLTLSLKEGVTVGSGSVSLTYDKSVLELESAEWTVSNTMLVNFDSAKNKGAFAYTSGTKISGKIFTAKFKVKSNAAFGAFPVSMVLELKDGSNVDMSVKNNSGKVTVRCKHSYSKWATVDGNNHTRTCSLCGDKETAKHAFSNACDTKCDSCGYTRTTTHTYKTVWSSDASRHWYECSACQDKKDLAAHTPGPAATETAPQTCTTCGYVLQAALGHTHKPSGDWLSDVNTHWHDCATCDEKAGEAAHSYDSTCDEDCNVCGYKRTVTHTFAEAWTSDESGHWYSCTLCGGKDNVVAHVPGAEATEEAPQVCTVCQFEIAPPKAHEHKHEGDYLADGEGHWKDCRCGDHSQKEDHTFDGGTTVKEPTATEIGEKHYTCSGCGYVKSVEVELGATASSPADAGGFSVVSLFIGIAIGAVFGVGVMLIVTKKKR